jgi:hypothetical protein
LGPSTRNECPNHLGIGTAGYEFSKESVQCFNGIAPNAEKEDVQARTWPTNICLQSSADKLGRVLPHKIVKGMLIPSKSYLGCILAKWKEQCLPSPAPFQWQENRSCCPPQRSLAPPCPNLLPSRPWVHRPLCLPETTRVSETTRTRMGPEYDERQE